MASDRDRKAQEREKLKNIINQWNVNRLDIFWLSEPNEDLEFHGAMRFYFQDAGQKVATKCIRVSSTATTTDVIQTLIEKFRPDIRMLSIPEYALYEIHENGEERKLRPDEMPLWVQLDWHKDDREGRFLLRRMDEKSYISSMDACDTENFKRKLSKREKKDKKKKEKREKLKAAEESKKDGIAEHLYSELPETSFTRSISNPEAVMRRRRQQILERKLQQFCQEGGTDAGGTLRIFGESLNKDVPYKTLLLSTKDSASYVVKEILDKYGYDKEDPAQYCLVQVIVSSQGQNENNPDFQNSGGIREYILDDDDCPLMIQHQHNRNRGTLTFHVRRRPADYQPRKRKKKPKPTKGEDPNYHPDNTTEKLPYLLELNPDGSEPPGPPKKHRLYLNVTEVGSERSSSTGGQYLQLFGPNVQPRHCVIAHTERIVTVTPSSRDAETYVNNMRIYETTILQNGMVVRFGKLHTFRFVDPLHDQGQAISLQNLMKNVHQQWLVADLEEIACSSLPQELPTVQKITLNTNFALQVQGIRDISKPAYSQLKQLEGSVNSNAEFSSAPAAPVPEWEAKPTRMLMLNLTDGCTHIQGMEYKTINFLSPNLSPGIKVLIKGPVDCRFGVLLLSPHNICILGGEVESKLQLFSRENILKEQLHLPTDETVQGSAVIPNHTNNNQESPNNYRISNLNSFNDRTQRNQIPHNTASAQSHLQSRNVMNIERNAEDILDHFESDDDDFVQNLDYGKIDEIENSQMQTNEHIIPEPNDDIWQEDEDMVRDMMEFQDKNPDFEMPFEIPDNSDSGHSRRLQGNNEIFTYLSTVVNDPSSDCVITIKGFIITVLSKLECTPSKGWNLTVKINDGSATVDASIHDKVLEGIIGVSAQEMIKKQVLAAQNLEIRREVMEAISKCKLTLQNYNCLMDVKFTPGEKPCIVKLSPVTKLHIQQLLERVRSSF